MSKTHTAKFSNERAQSKAPNTLLLFHQATRHRVGFFDGMVIGRDGGHENFPNDESMSSRQCAFHLSPDGTVSCQEIGSVSRTRINGAMIPRGVVRSLRPGDRVEIGAQKFLVAIGDPTEPYEGASYYNEALEPEERTLRIVLPPKEKPEGRLARLIRSFLGIGRARTN